MFEDFAEDSEYSEKVGLGLFMAYSNIKARI